MENQMIRPNCTHPEGPHHDCDYVDARNSLIPQATREAAESLARKHPGQRFIPPALWASEFCDAMERLAELRFRGVH